jgi:hypothetical protein
VYAKRAFWKIEPMCKQADPPINVSFLGGGVDFEPFARGQNQPPSANICQVGKHTQLPLPISAKLLPNC